jgi:hypothetical protein
MELEGSQKIATGHCPEPDESNPYLQILVPSDPF